MCLGNRTPRNTRLIISAETPKSEMINVGRFIAMASSAAVDETVTKPRDVRKCVLHGASDEGDGVRRRRGAAQPARP